MASVTVLKHWSLVLRSIFFTSCVSQRRVQGHLLGMLLSLKNNSKNIVLLFWQYSSKNPCKHIVEPCHGTQWAPSACPCSCGWDRIGGQAGHKTKDRAYEELSSPSQRSQRRHCSVPDRPDSWELDGGKLLPLEVRTASSWDPGSRIRRTAQPHRGAGRRAPLQRLSSGTTSSATLNPCF